MTVFDAKEQRCLASEIGDRAFPWFVVGADSKDLISGVRVYYVARVDGEFSIQMRCVDMRRLAQDNSTSVKLQIQSACALVNSEMKDLGAWVADGCSVNGVRPRQDELGENVFAKLQAEMGGEVLMRYWAACHRLDLVLKDMWRLAICPGIKNHAKRYN